MHTNPAFHTIAGIRPVLAQNADKFSVLQCILYITAIPPASFLFPLAFNYFLC